MSVFVPVGIHCDHCGADAWVNAPISLQIRRFPLFRQHALDGTLCQYLCPQCERLVAIEPRLLYMDFDRWQFYAVLPARALPWRAEIVPRIDAIWQRNMRSACPELVREEWAPRFMHRVVFGVPQLTEKLRIAEAGLDDRIVETMKIVLAFGRRHLFGGTEILFTGCDPEALHFERQEPPGPEALSVGVTWAVPRYRYQQFAREPERWAAVAPEVWGEWVVDWRCTVAPEAAMPAEEAVGLAELDALPA